MSTLSIHVVIARYNESLEWLSYFNPDQLMNVWIYNKGEPITVPGVPEHQIRTLNNVGRESHTYLTHIMMEYHNLPSAVLFLQGDPFCHIRIPQNHTGFQEWYSKVCVDLQTKGFTQNYVNTTGDPLVAPEFRLLEWAGHQLLSAGCGLGPWIEKYVQTPYPQYFIWYMGACFGVSSTNIRGRSREYYQNLIDQLQHPNPEAGHYMERSWVLIFQGNVTSA